MSDKTKPPLRLLLFEIPDVESKDKEVARLVEAGTATGNGSSRDDGGSTPALGTKKKKRNLAVHKNWTQLLVNLSTKIYFSSKEM